VERVSAAQYERGGVQVVKLTLVVPYYSQPEMLALQEDVWRQYPSDVSVIVVDDCSPVPAKSTVAQVRRITERIPWNVAGAQNLGALCAKTEWLAHIEIDHTLPVPDMLKLLAMDLRKDTVYYFNRINEGMSYGHFVCNRQLYWEIGGMDEDFSGHYGMFEFQFKSVAPRTEVLPLWLVCHNEKEFSYVKLERDPGRNIGLYHEKNGQMATRPLRFKWE
jgi:hypothetical protein